ncbi:MAG: helix-turn-helix transcriptional regulator [Bacteroidia bacterium]|nr:helix-turn-helix transcriptional regulator [Bacteroidia bacterium]
MEDLDRILVGMIITERKRQGMSRETLAEKINYPLGTVNDIEGGRTRRIPANFVLRACKLLGIDINKAIQGEESYTAVKDSDLGTIKADLQALKDHVERQNRIFFNRLEIDQKRQIEEGRDEEKEDDDENE